MVQHKMDGSTYREEQAFTRTGVLSVSNEVRMIRTTRTDRGIANISGKHELWFSFNMCVLPFG